MVFIGFLLMIPPRIIRDRRGEGARGGPSNFLRLHGLVDYAGTGKGLILRGRLRRRDTTWPPLNRISPSCKQIAPEEPKSSASSFYHVSY